MKSELINHLEKLKYFKVVAESESFYRASLKLGISQPALTRSIQSLEYVLDTKLFIRNSRGVKMTTQGEDLLALAKEIFLKVESWNSSSSLTGTSSKPIKQFRIGTYDNLATSLLPTLIKSIEDKSESFDFKLLAGPSNSFLTLELLEKKLDYILVAEPQQQRGVSYQTVAEEHYGFFASTQFLKTHSIKENQISTGDLKNYRLLTIPGAIAGISKTVDRLLWEVSISKGSEFNSFEVVKSAMLQNLGICLIPTLSIWKELKDKQVRQIFIKGVPKTNLGRHKMYLCSRSQDNEAQFQYLVETIQFKINEIRNLKI